MNATVMIDDQKQTGSKTYGNIDRGFWFMHTQHTIEVHDKMSTTLTKKKSIRRRQMKHHENAFAANPVGWNCLRVIFTKTVSKRYGFSMKIGFAKRLTRTCV